MDIIRAHCLECGKAPESNAAINEVRAFCDGDGNMIAHLVLMAGRPGYMITDEQNYRPWFQKCVCSLVCGMLIIERHARRRVKLQPHTHRRLSVTS